MESRFETKFGKYGKEEYWVHYKANGYWSGEMFSNKEEANEYYRKLKEVK